MKKKFIRGVLIGTGVFIVTVLLYQLNIFRSLEWKFWDLQLHLFSQPSQASEEIVLVLIDQESLDFY